MGRFRCVHLPYFGVGLPTSLADIFNASASAVVRVYRIQETLQHEYMSWHIGGKVLTLLVRRITSVQDYKSTITDLGTSQGSITQEDFNGNGVPAGVSSCANRDVVATDTLIRRIRAWGSAGQDGSRSSYLFFLGVPCGILFEAGFHDTRVEPLVCRTNEGIDVALAATFPGTAGQKVRSPTYEFEFTA